MDKRKAWIFSILLALLVEFPFVLLFMQGPHSARGGIGMLFFLPGFELVSLFSKKPNPLVLILLSQTLLISIPIFWGIRWRRRPAVTTIVQIVSFLVILTITSRVHAGFTMQRLERRKAIQSAGSNAAPKEIATLNKALALSKAKYGKYPIQLEQLDFPPSGAMDSGHAGLLSFPSPMEEFFTFTYVAGANSAYEIYVDARPGNWSGLDHYYSDASGLIRFDVTHETCNKGPVIYPYLDPSYL